MTPSPPSPPPPEHHVALLNLLRAKGLTRRDEPVKLASGQRSRYFVDAKRAFAAGPDLSLVATAITEAVRCRGIDFDAVGGLTLGADALGAAIAIVSDTSWFVIRKQPKGRGTDRLIEGVRLGPDSRVLLIDDVVTTGGSILRAYDTVRAVGASVVAAATLLDRGHEASAAFTQRSVPYLPFATYADLGIPAVGSE